MVYLYQIDILNKKIKINSAPTGLIVAPTRELALQVFEEIIWLLKKQN